MIYGREALRRFREEEQQAEHHPHTDLLSQIPPDAPMDDATLTVWNGERWVAWEKWLATAPIIVDEPLQQETKAAPAADTRPRGSNRQEGLWQE